MAIVLLLQECFVQIFSDAIIINRWTDRMRNCFDFIHGIVHSNTCSGILHHWNIIFGIAECDDFLWINVMCCTETM